MIILDSSFLVAFHNTRDVHHEAASRIMPQLISGKWGQALLPEYVFLEVATVLLARRGREAATKVTRILLQAREVEFVPCSELFLDTLETFRSQPGRKLSFTDAAIVTIARRREEAVVATFDRGFAEVEGVAVVPEVDTAPRSSASG